ncbi:hypothetical protein PspLS_11842 [Pyricularia sp. CBS 133598]|nr:hypothetical protein PspLS_11842 [Pyricularia sp. CBS 133598]
MDVYVAKTEGAGTVRIDEYEEYQPALGAPLEDAPGMPQNGPQYQVSWTHQLHCLWWIMKSYDEVVRFGATGYEGTLEKGHPRLHLNHCFEFLRQVILCQSDQTLEGRSPDNAYGANGIGKTHICRDNEASKRWIESRRVNDYTSVGQDAPAPVYDEPPHHDHHHHHEE